MRGWLGSFVGRLPQVFASSWQGVFVAVVILLQSGTPLVAKALTYDPTIPGWAQAFDVSVYRDPKNCAGYQPASGAQVTIVYEAFTNYWNPFYGTTDANGKVRILLPKNRPSDPNNKAISSVLGITVGYRRDPLRPPVDGNEGTGSVGPAWPMPYLSTQVVTVPPIVLTEKSYLYGVGCQAPTNSTPVTPPATTPAPIVGKLGTATIFVSRVDGGALSNAILEWRDGAGNTITQKVSKDGAYMPVNVNTISFAVSAEGYQRREVQASIYVNGKLASNFFDIRLMPRYSNRKFAQIAYQWYLSQPATATTWGHHFLNWANVTTNRSNLLQSTLGVWMAGRPYELAQYLFRTTHEREPSQTDVAAYGRELQRQFVSTVSRSIISQDHPTYLFIHWVYNIVLCRPPSLGEVQSWFPALKPGGELERGVHLLYHFAIPMMASGEAVGQAGFKADVWVSRLFEIMGKQPTQAELEAKIRSLARWGEEAKVMDAAGGYQSRHAFLVDWLQNDPVAKGVLAAYFIVHDINPAVPGSLRFIGGSGAACS